MQQQQMLVTAAACIKTVQHTAVAAAKTPDSAIPAAVVLQ